MMMLQEKAFTLFCECLCGNAASFEELKNLSTQKSRFAIGTKVLTHSLTSGEFNNLNGTVSGAATMKNGVLRIPVIVESTKGEKQIMALKPENLSLTDTDTDTGGEGTFPASTPEYLVIMGYFGLFSLINENVPIPTIEAKAIAALTEVYSRREEMALDTCPHAQYLIGECYEYGIPEILPRDAPKALEWYCKAAAQGHAGAQCELGYCVHNGEGLALDQAAGVKLYRQAAEQGYAKAQYYMGVASFYGQGIVTDTKDPEDFEAAVRWYQLAADQGYAAAQSTLGFCYQVGKGCSMNVEKAEKYFKLAAKQGDAYASAKLESLNDFVVV